MTIKVRLYILLVVWKPQDGLVSVKYTVRSIRKTTTYVSFTNNVPL